ncbi:MAG: LPS export ABC transporter periplasmic protein LptC [bacterium]|nr:LPS export ABC transporter periplasmic protein LptC [bacterium]
MMRYFNIFILLVLTLGCKGQKKNDSVSDFDKNLPDGSQVIMNFKLTESANGETSFKLAASKAIIYSETTLVYRIKLNFFKNGAFYGELIADSGTLFTESNDMEAFGNVKVTGIEGAVLESKELKWSNARQKIYTEGEVLITTKDKKISGKNFESNPDLTNIKLKETSGSGVGTLGKIDSIGVSKPSSKAKKNEETKKESEIGGMKIREYTGRPVAKKDTIISKEIPNTKTNTETEKDTVK